MKPATSWLLVIFVSAAAGRELRPPFLNHTRFQNTATQGLVPSPCRPDSLQDSVRRTCCRFCGGSRDKASPGAAARRSLMGGDRTCAFRVSSEHPVHIPALAGMRTGDEPKAAFLWQRRECSPGSAPPQAPPSGLRTPVRAGAPWRRGRLEAGPSGPRPLPRPPPAALCACPLPAFWIQESPPFSSPESFQLPALIRTPERFVASLATSLHCFYFLLFAANQTR